jgi:hypothetical protein
MSDDILQALIHVAAVTLGLFVLWSLVGAMRRLSRVERFGAALAAGLISAAVVLLIRLAA